MVKDLFLRDFLKLNLKFFSGRQQLRRALKLRKKVISMALPPGLELVLAAGAVPIFLCRIGDNSGSPFLQAAHTYKNIFGWNLLTSGVRFLRPLVGDRFFSDLIDQFLTTLYKTYQKYIDVAENEGSPLDACFGTRLLLGATWPQLNKIHGTLGLGTRCNWFSKVFEEIQEKSKVIMLEIPLIEQDHGEEMMLESLNLVIGELEELTGNTITNEKLRQRIIQANEIRESYLKILEIWSRDIIRIHPLTFTNLLSLLHIAFTDFLCEPKFFNKTLKDYAKELGRGSNLKCYDTHTRPKVILVNAFGGYEPNLPAIIEELDGRLLIADWEVLRVLDKIDTQGDILRNYAHYLLGFEQAWMDNTTLVKRYIDVALKYGVDGILFNSIYGCKSITPSLKLFKTYLQDTELTLVDIGFQNIEDNLSQTRTRIGAAFEVIRTRKGF
ncbi:MAG: 2-hydroxyacyl-CoA dehydratase [Candidatus Helarchaeota archaeon]